MPGREQQRREEIVQTGRRMYERGWLAANDGNITVRLDDQRILATPTGVCKGQLRPEELLICDNDGNKLSGQRERTTEMAMHLAIYRVRPDIHAVVHAHPPVSTGFAVAGRALNLGLMPELIVSMGSVPLAEYGLPGTPALVEGMLLYIPKYDAILLANHGAVCYGENLAAAFARMETLEHLARITLVAELLGGPKILPKQEVDKLFGARSRYGVKSQSGMEPGRPVVAEDGESSGERFHLTRDDLIALVEDALRARGMLA